MNILACVESVPRVMATEALHYCLRALEHAGEPGAPDRDFFFDVPSCAPGPESRALTLNILSGIEQAECMNIHHLDRATAAAYIHEISETISTLTRRMPGFDPKRGEELLRKMRAASLVGQTRA
jgi:hypothetical protein